MRDFFSRWFWIALEQLDAGHDHPRRAIAALQPVLLPKTFLHRMQFSIRGEPLDGRDLAIFGLHRKQGARLDRFAIEQDRACAANGSFATDVRARELAMLAQVVHQQHARFNFVGLFGSVYLDLYQTFHASLPSSIGRLPRPSPALPNLSLRTADAIRKTTCGTFALCARTKRLLFCSFPFGTGLISDAHGFDSFGRQFYGYSWQGAARSEAHGCGPGLARRCVRRCGGRRERRQGGRIRAAKARE